MNTKNKQMALKDMINKGLNASNKKMISFRIDDKTIEKLRIIANRKKTTQTKVITELIMIAHATLYTPLGEGLNELYTLILDKGIKKKSIKKTVKNEEAIINEIKIGEKK